MRSDISPVLNVLLLLLFTRGGSSAAPPVSPLSHANTSASPHHVTEDPGNEILTRSRNPAVGGETSAETTSISATTGLASATNAALPTHLWSTSVAAATPARTDAALVMTTDTGPASSAAAAHGLSSTPPPPPPPPSSTPLHLDSTTESGTILATAPLTTTSPSPSMSSSARASTTITFTTAQETQSEARTTGRPLTPTPVPVGPKHQEVPSELNAGDEDLMGPPFHPSSPLDPLLAGLLTVFIITTAIVFVVLFLKLRQRTAHPEFHRLQDLPMEDLMEDTPLSRYPY